MCRCCSVCKFGSNKCTWRAQAIGVVPAAGCMPAHATMLPASHMTVQKNSKLTCSHQWLCTTHTWACLHLPGSDGSQELHHSLVHVLVVENLQHLMPGLARAANNLQHVLQQNSAQMGSHARVARRLAEASLNIGYCDCSNLAHTSAKLVCTLSL